MRRSAPWRTTRRSDGSPAELTHHFTGPGTINMGCRQNGLTNGGTMFSWTAATIVATQVSSLTSTAVTSERDALRLRAPGPGPAGAAKATIGDGALR